MPDQPDYYATIHWGSQGRAVQSPRDWDVLHVLWVFNFQEGDLASGASDTTDIPVVPAGKVMLVDGWGGSMSQPGIFSLRRNSLPIQYYHRLANDGLWVPLISPEYYSEIYDCLLTVTNQGTVSGHYYLFIQGRLVDA